MSSVKAYKAKMFDDITWENWIQSLTCRVKGKSFQLHIWTSASVFDKNILLMFQKLRGNKTSRPPCTLPSSASGPNYENAERINQVKCFNQPEAVEKWSIQLQLMLFSLVYSAWIKVSHTVMCGFDWVTRSYEYRCEFDQKNTFKHTFVWTE